MARNGFTLLELLVAMVLLSLVFLVLNSSFQLTTKIWSRDLDAARQQFVPVSSLLRSLLSQVKPVEVENSGTEQRHIYFFGEARSLRFIGPMPSTMGISGLYEGYLHVTEAQGGDSLVLDYRLWHERGEWRSATIAEHLEGFEFSYFGYRGAREAPRWYDEWQALRSVPDLIRLRIATTDFNWPDLVISLPNKTMTVVPGETSLF
jgi:general secretion pathway protein J